MGLFRQVHYKIIKCTFDKTDGLCLQEVHKLKWDASEHQQP